MTPQLATLLEQLLGPDLPIAIEAYDGSRLGPADAPATLQIRSPAALRRIVQAPGELGFGRAYVAGDLDLEGDIFAALALRDHMPDVKLRPAQWVAALRLVGPGALKPVPKPPEEARLHGRRHSKQRDAAAISHHYDVSNDFYRRVLGPSMTYSCAVWTDSAITLEEAQANKHELICRKLGLEPGMRLLDIGCGWGGMLLHAAERHGVQAVGVTLSKRQAELAEKRAAEAGLAGKVEVRYQDYRDVDDGPYDAISSIGMFEHVGLRQLAVYFERCFELLPAGGRLLNHAISRPPGVSGSTADGRSRFARRSFIDRYVFPDGELHEVGSVDLRDPARRVRGAAHGEPPRALRAHPAGVGREPRGELGRVRGRRRPRPGPHLAALHGRVGAPVRGESHAGAPGAGDQAGPWPQRSPAPAALRVATPAGSAPSASRAPPARPASPPV